MDYVNSDKLLFISASPAGAGHRLGRIVSCFDNVYWYANKQRNGINPWDIFPTTLVKGKNISPYHFDRRTSKNMIPLLGERIERYWNPEDLDLFYKGAWSNDMALAGANDIITKKHLVWVVHDTPEYLLSRFPNAKVINLLDNEILPVVNRYLETTALFPINLENRRLKPEYHNEYATKLIKLQNVNSDPTYRDFWAWNTYNTPNYNTEFDQEYFIYVYELINNLHREKSKTSHSYFTMSWDSFSLDTIKHFLGSNIIDINVQMLLTQ